MVNVVNLVEGLSREIARVTELRGQYESVRGPGVLVEPQIRMMNSAIEIGHKAMGSGDILAMASIYTALKEIQA